MLLLFVYVYVYVYVRARTRLAYSSLVTELTPLLTEIKCYTLPLKSEKCNSSQMVLLRV